MITLYTTGCPRCKVLESKLEAAGLTYGKVTDENVIIGMGFQTVPVMTIDGKVMSFSESINWINNYIAEKAVK
jgi:glutaredoxin